MKEFIDEWGCVWTMKLLELVKNVLGLLWRPSESMVNMRKSNFYS